MRAVSKKRSNECSECNKTFASKQNLDVHFRTHTGEKPYACTVCGQKFNTKGNVTQHMKVHTGEKP